MSQADIILLILLALGVLGKNNTVAIAAGVLLLSRLVGLNRFFPHLEEHGLTAGIIILTVAVFIPMASGDVTLAHISQTFRDPRGLAAVVIGVLVAYLGGQGVHLLSDKPQIVTGLMVGTVIGVAFFKGVPVGPLIAAGIASVLFSLTKI